MQPINPQPVKSADQLLRVVRCVLDDRIESAQRNRLPLIVLQSRHLFEPTAPGHHHARPELFIQLSGASIMQLPERTVRSPAGSITLVPRGVPHGEHGDSTSSIFTNLVFMYDDAGLGIHIARAKEPERSAYSSIQIEHRLTMHVDDGERLYGYLNEVGDFVRQGFAVDHPAVIGLMLTHLAVLREALNSSGVSIRNQSPIVAQCHRIIQEELTSSDMSVRWLAARVRCSPDYLSNLFHRERGVTLTRHINNERIGLARQFLDSTSMNISEIAASCGYGDPSYFSRIFSKVVGCSPRVFRGRKHT